MRWWLITVLKPNDALPAQIHHSSHEPHVNQEKTIMNIAVETLVSAPIAKVWNAYTSPEDIMQWNAASDDWHTTAASVDLREGGSFSSHMEAKDGSFGFDFAGTYTKIVVHQRIEYAFGDRAAVVDFMEGEQGITVRVSFDAESSHSIDQQRDGWQAILNSFTRHVHALEIESKRKVDNGITVWTYDWVPEYPRGHVRDIRLRWAMEEAGISYTVKTVPFDGRGADHMARQPFAQVPFLDDGDIRLFESGACLLHLAEKSELLMPREPQAKAETLQWVIAALNSVEMVTVPWWVISFSKPSVNPLADWMRMRLEHLEAFLTERDWFAASRFTVADIMMSDALRILMRVGALDGYPVLTAYVKRACAREAFQKAFRDQVTQFEAADLLRK
jgi:glutathione S-transferase